MDLHDLLHAELGPLYDDLRTSLPSNPGGRYGPFRTRPLSGVRYIAVHHTAGPKDQTWQIVAAEHIRPTANGGRLEAAGIGYHIGIRRGRVSYLGDVSTARANVGDLNHLVVGVCVTGDYTREALDVPDRDALAHVVRVLDTFFGRQLIIAGHGALPGQATACPGAPLTAILGALRAAAPAPVPVPGVVLADALRTAGAAAQKIRLNKGAAVQEAIARDGFVPTSNEFELVHAGARYIGQRAEHLTTGAVRVYHCRAGDWGHVEAVIV
jgi:hypothetical protein